MKSSKVLVFSLGLLVFLSSWSWVRGEENVPLAQMLQTLKPRWIGPANMSGRLTEVAVYEARPQIMYVASASGGLWKTENNATTWKSVFDRETSVALGAVAVAQTDPNIVWIGTGEANARNSVSWGDGVYKSSDGGKNWQHMGLKETHHIGRIVIHPTNPNIVYVAALGRLWGPNKERGLFKTSDGGKTWQLSKFINDKTGFIDLAMDPSNPDVLCAAAYSVRRDAFSGGNPAVQIGPGAGLYRSKDGGITWTKLTKGLPTNSFGRCGVSIYRKDPRIVYAVVQTEKTPVTVAGQAANKKLELSAGGIFRSEDAGETWTHVNSLVPRPFYYGQIRVDPNDEKRIYVLGIEFHYSSDGGATFKAGAKDTHADYHALWINPRDSYHLVLGTDGGLNFSYDKGATWERLYNLPVAQFYAIGVDMRKPYRIYGGLQDNGSWGGPSASRDGRGISSADWFNILGYDGYYCQVDAEDQDIVFAEGQYGILRRINVSTFQTTDIKPFLSTKDYKSNINPEPKKHAGFRFNWSSPILLSRHQPKTVYYAANQLFRSMDRGDTWTIISPDLTRGKPGPSAYNGHTITTIAESPVKEGLLYVGTDDGRVHVSRPVDERSWEELSEKIPDVPQERWISRVECSHFEEGTVYLSIDRHRNDDRAPYLFKSTDFGQTWKSLVNNLPTEGPIYVVREDPVNPALLYVGTEFGLFVSLDSGTTWHKQQHLPTVPVHDLVVHPRERELVIATHGRGIYIMDVLPLQELTPKVLENPSHLFTIRPAQAYRQKLIRFLGIKQFVGENPPYGAGFYVFLKEIPSAAPKVSIQNAAGKLVLDLKMTRDPGLHRLTWRLNHPGTDKGMYNPVPAGTYTAVLHVGKQQMSQQFTVEVEE